MPMIPYDEAARDIALEQGDGSELRLSTLWNEGPVVLFFLRHFG